MEIQKNEKIQTMSHSINTICGFFHHRTVLSRKWADNALVESIKEVWLCVIYIVFYLIRLLSDLWLWDGIYSYTP